MGYFDANIDPMDFDARQQRLKYQQALLQQLRGMGDQNPGTGQMVSGRFVPTTTGQKLAPAIAGIGHSFIAPMVQQRQDTLNQDMTRGASDWMTSRPLARTLTKELPGPQPEGEEGPLIGSQTVQPTQQENLEWANRGMANPMTRALAAAYSKDQLIDEPDRLEQRQFKAQESSLQRAQLWQQHLDRMETQKSRLEQQAEAARIRSEDVRLGIDQRREAAEQANALRLQIAQMTQELGQQRIEAQREMAQLRADIAAKGKAAPKPLPAAQSKAWIDNNVSIKKVEEALGMVVGPDGKPTKQALQSLGALNYLPFADEVRQRTDPDGVMIRAKVGDIGSLKIHDRSGAAVTAAEFPRLKPFIPRASDDATAVATKLSNFLKEYRLIQQEIEDYAETQGYKSPRVPSGGGQTQERKTVNGKSYVKIDGQWFEE